MSTYGISLLFLSLSQWSYIFFFLFALIKGSDSSSVERFLDETAAVKYRIEDDKRLLVLLLLLDIAVADERLLEDREEEFSIQLLSDPDCIEVFINDGYLNLSDEDGDDDDDEDKENGCADLSAYFPLSSG